jgi:hypothetical protein
MLKIVSAIGLIVSCAGTAAAQTQVNGYTTKNGTYVAPHVRSAPNSTPTDNYGVRPNVNPYTGQAGTRAPTPSYGVPPLPSPYATK